MQTTEFETGYFFPTKIISEIAFVQKNLTFFRLPFPILASQFKQERANDI